MTLISDLPFFAETFFWSCISFFGFYLLSFWIPALKKMKKNARAAMDANRKFIKPFEFIFNSITTIFTVLVIAFQILNQPFVKTALANMQARASRVAGATGLDVSESGFNLSSVPSWFWVFCVGAVLIVWTAKTTRKPDEGD